MKNSIWYSAPGLELQPLDQASSTSPQNQASIERVKRRYHLHPRWSLWSILTILFTYQEGYWILQSFTFVRMPWSDQGRPNIMLFFSLNSAANGPSIDILSRIFSKVPFKQPKGLFLFGLPWLAMSFDIHGTEFINSLCCKYEDYNS